MSALTNPRRVATVTSLAAMLALAGCGRGDESARRAASAGPAHDTAAAAPAAHDMAAMHDSSSAASMPGMNHGAMPDSGHAGMEMPPTAATTAGMDHSGMAGMEHGTAGGAGRGGAMPGMNHSAVSGGGHAGMAGMDHSAMSSASYGGAHAMAGMPEMNHSAGEHAGMPGMKHSAGEHAGMAGMDHAAGEHAAMAGMDHAGMAGMAMGGAGVHAPPADPATAKLLELGSALVRDTAVQRRIREDPALRARWSDPAVQRVIAPRP